MGQIITDPINQMITISELASAYVGYEILIWDLVSMDKFDSINRLIPLPMIPLNGTHCITATETPCKIFHARSHRIYKLFGFNRVNFGYNDSH